MHLEFVKSVLTEIFANHLVFRVEIVVGVDDVVGEIAFFLILLYFADIYEEVSDVFYQIFYVYHHDILLVFF